MINMSQNNPKLRRQMNIKSHLTDINDGMIYLVTDNIKPYISNYKKMNIYNKNLKYPFHKIWLKTPKMKVSNVFVSEKNKQVGLLHVSLYNTDNETEKLQNYLVQLEEYIGTIIDKDNELVCKSNVNYLYGAFPTLTLQLPIEKIIDKNIILSCHIYDENNQRVNYNQVTNEHLVEAYVEVSDIWIRPGEYGINLKVLQMQTSIDFNFNICLFQDEDNVFMNEYIPPPPNFISHDKIPSPPHQSHNNQLNKNSFDDTPKSMSFIPNANQLIEMRKNLRPTPLHPTKLKPVKKIKGEKGEKSPTISDEYPTPKHKNIKKKKIIKKVKRKNTSISDDSIISEFDDTNTDVNTENSCKDSPIVNSFDDSIDDDIDLNIGLNEITIKKDSVFIKDSPEDFLEDSSKDIKPKKKLKKKKKIVKKKPTTLVEN